MLSSPSLSLENITGTYQDTSCEGETWSISLVIRNNEDRNLTVLLYIDALLPQTNITVEEAVWRIHLIPLEVKLLSGVMVIKNPNPKGNLTFTARVVPEGGGELKAECPLCRGSGRVTLIDFIRFHSRKGFAKFYVHLLVYG